MVLNKRLDLFDDESKVLFNHNHIATFMERHNQYLNYEEAIKVFIMSRKFRLSIQFISQTKFVIDYFTMSLESNSYDIAFYLFAQHEDSIVLEYGKVMNSLANSF